MVSKPEPVMTMPERTVPAPASPLTFVMVSADDAVPFRGWQVKSPAQTLLASQLPSMQDLPHLPEMQKVPPWH